MSYQHKKIADVAARLEKRLAAADTAEARAGVLRATELKALYAEIPLLPVGERAGFGKELNQLKAHLERLVAAAAEAGAAGEQLPPIDVTAPFDANVPSHKRPRLLPADRG